MHTPLISAFSRGRAEVGTQGHPWLHSEFQTGLGCVRPCLERSNKQNVPIRWPFYRSSSRSQTPFSATDSTLPQKVRCLGLSIVIVQIENVPYSLMPSPICQVILCRLAFQPHEACKTHFYKRFRTPFQGWSVIAHQGEPTNTISCLHHLINDLLLEVGRVLPHTFISVNLDWGAWYVKIMLGKTNPRAYQTN